LLPSFWFAAPLELAAGETAAPAWGRLALATGSVALLVVSGASLATGLGRKLLEPEPRAAGGQVLDLLRERIRQPGEAPRRRDLARVHCARRNRRENLLSSARCAS